MKIEPMGPKGPSKGKKPSIDVMLGPEGGKGPVPQISGFN